MLGTIIRAIIVIAMVTVIVVLISIIRLFRKNIYIMRGHEQQKVPKFDEPTNTKKQNLLKIIYLIQRL